MLEFMDWLSLFLLIEGDEGLRAFIDSQNASFKTFLKQLLAAKKITDPRLVREAEALVADDSNELFNYGRELVRLASSGRGRLSGGDALHGATEAAGKIWEELWRPDSFAGTWEDRFPNSVHRGGLRGTIRAVAANIIGHFAQRLRKSGSRIATYQLSQIGDTPLDPEDRATPQESEWEQWREAILVELRHDLEDELRSDKGGKHWESRVRNLRWAVEIVNRQMAFPYHWRSMPEVMAEIPELRIIGRGGLQQILANLINDARHRALDKIGSEREQAVALSLQRRRPLSKVEAVLV